MGTNNEGYKGIYAMHKYWGKKPFNEISKFIRQYSNENDTVMDCFCGSGVTLIEAVKEGRKAIGIDLNPIAIKLAKASLTPVSINLVDKAFKSIQKTLKDKINSLYKFTYDNQETDITHIIWREDIPIEVWYKIKGDKTKKIRKGLQEDIEMANNPKEEPLWYPTTDMFENSRINVNKNQKVCDLFTKRALVGLSLIANEISKIEAPSVKSLFELTLTGTLSQASKLVFVIRNRKKNEDSEPKADVGSWVIGYWVPKEHFEINVWNCFENRYKRILKGVEEINSLFQNDKDINSKYKLYNCSATINPLTNESVDYVFIDPPHSNRVLYMEQSLMWNSWLKLDTKMQWEDEIIVSEAKERKNKDKENYTLLLGNAFSEIKRVLKKGKYFSFAFNCLDDKIWINTLNLFTQHGFSFVDITPLEYSATSVIQDNRKNALKTDFVLTFKNDKLENQNKIIFNEDESKLIDSINNLLLKNPAYEVYNIMNSLFQDTLPEGYIYKVSEIVKKCSEIMD